MNSTVSSITSERSAAFETHYTVAQLAKQWGLSQSTVLRQFKQADGVLRIGNVRSKKRTKISLRIPASVAERVHKELTHGAGA